MKRFRLLLQRLRTFRFRRGSFSVNRLRAKSKSILTWRSRDQSRRVSGMEKSQRLRSRTTGQGNLGPRNRALLLACNPCAGSSSGMVVESYKFQIQGDKLQRQENWQRERTWSIVTRVGDDFVTKKVILKKMKMKKVTADARNGDLHLQRENSRSRRLAEDDPLENTGSSSRYRLSTSSSNADGFGLESQMYSWDKELSFTSGDDPEEIWPGGFDHEVFDRLEGSTKDVFVDLPSCRSVHRHFPSPDDSTGVKMPLKELLTDENHPENHHEIHKGEDDASTMAREIAKVSLEDFKIDLPGEETMAEEQEQEQEQGEGVSLGKMFSPDKMSQQGSNCKGIFGEEGKDSEDEEGEKRKGMGVAVMKVSSDPYRDYRDSMLEMSLAYGLQDVCEFEELLRCYLELNPPDCHSTIVEAFLELVRHRLFI